MTTVSKERSKISAESLCESVCWESNAYWTLMHEPFDSDLVQSLIDKFATQEEDYEELPSRQEISNYVLTTQKEIIKYSVETNWGTDWNSLKEEVARERAVEAYVNLCKISLFDEITALLMENDKLTPCSVNSIPITVNEKGYFQLAVGKSNRILVLVQEALETRDLSTCKF